MYEGVQPTDQHVRMLWAVLERFTAPQQERFLQFVWARSRLPATAADFRLPFTVKPAAACMAGDPDSFLPKSETCFFALSLPRYTSAAVLRQRLLYAIQNCAAMDADFATEES